MNKEFGRGVNAVYSARLGSSQIVVKLRDSTGRSAGAEIKLLKQLKLEGKAVRGLPQMLGLMGTTCIEGFDSKMHVQTFLPCGIADLIASSLPAGITIWKLAGAVGDAVAGLSWLHSKKIVHNDVKAENIVVAPGRGHCEILRYFGDVRR